MSNVIVYKNNDGSCGIIVANENLFNSDSPDRKILKERGIDFDSDQNILEWLAKKQVPKDKEWRIVDISNIPNDRYFRNAWTDDEPTETVDINLSKAKEIKKNILRSLRVPILSKLDIDFMRAQEVGDSQLISQIIQKKNDLRNVTNLPMPDDIEQLKNFVPEILKT